jgi:hypothetical protein
MNFYFCDYYYSPSLRHRYIFCFTSAVIAQLVQWLRNKPNNQWIVVQPTARQELPLHQNPPNWLWVHPASYWVGTKGSFQGGNMARTLSQTLTSILCIRYEWVGLNLHSTITCNRDFTFSHLPASPPSITTVQMLQKLTLYRYPHTILHTTAITNQSHSHTALYKQFMDITQQQAFFTFQYRPPFSVRPVKNLLELAGRPT